MANWADLTSNQLVSFESLQSGVNGDYFSATGTPIPESLQLVPKEDVETYVVISTTYTPYANKAANQLVTKANLRGRAIFVISNSSTNITIDDIQVNSISVVPTSGTFPITPGNSAQAYSLNWGPNENIGVTWTAPAGSNRNITVIDSNSSSECQVPDDSGSATYTYSSKTLNPAVFIYVTASDGGCSPP